MPPEPRTARQTTAPVKKSVRVRDVPAVTRSIAILRLLGRTNQALGVKAIADELGLVPSTCLHILRVLVSEELVKLEPGTKHYALGSGMISLARSVLKGGSFAQLAQPGLDRLASSFGVTAMGVEVTPKQTVVVLALSRSMLQPRALVSSSSFFHWAKLGALSHSMALNFLRSAVQFSPL